MTTPTTLPPEPEPTQAWLRHLFWGNGFSGTDADREAVFLDLIARGLDVNQRGGVVMPLFLLASERMTPRMLEAMIGVGLDVGLTDTDGQGVFHRLTSTFFCDETLWVKAERVFALGADPGLSDNQGNTPLHNACARGNLQWIRWLLEHGAGPDAANRRGESPKDVACTEKPPGPWDFVESPGSICLFIDAWLEKHLERVLPKAAHSPPAPSRL